MRISSGETADVLTIIDNGVNGQSKLPDKTTDAMPPVFFTPDKVLKLIKQLIPKGSTGPNAIPEFFKVTGGSVNYFNVSLQTGELPAIWKCASVTPVFKKGAANNPSNYRPISMTCISCKLLECGSKESVLSHLLHNNIISRHQHGFF